MEKFKLRKERIEELEEEITNNQRVAVRFMNVKNVEKVINVVKHNKY